MKRAKSTAAETIGRQIGRVREEWGLSQSQFAALFMTDTRTVRRWENGQLPLSLRHQWFFGLFVQYARNNGVDRFLNRFVADEHGRFSQAGRPQR
jgi:transcriptional regulator with XRE-family HTH domain